MVVPAISIETNVFIPENILSAELRIQIRMVWLDPDPGVLVGSRSGSFSLDPDP